MRPLLHLLPLRSRLSEQVLNKVVIHLMYLECSTKAMGSSRKVELIEVLVCLHQCIHDLKSGCRIDIIIQLTVDQQQLALEKMCIVNI